MGWDKEKLANELTAEELHTEMLRSAVNVRRNTVVHLVGSMLTKDTVHTSDMVALAVKLTDEILQETSDD